MDDVTIDRIFYGSLIELPVVNSKIVRIFTSSTFTDMSLERNFLMQNVYPKIKDYCKEKFGLEFQIVDMRWGVRDEATDDHSTTLLCLNEIKNCQRLSVGPNFVVFLGQKYGYRPIPTYIDSEQFFSIQAALRELNCSELAMLNLWYVEDRNAVPPVFILQPISSILVNFNEKGKQDLRERDQRKWWQTLETLQRILRKAAEYLHRNNLLTDEQRHNFFMSVTEREVIHGLLTWEDTKSNCLAYVRHIKSIDFQETKTVSKFVDLLPNGEIDSQAQQLLSDLRDVRLPSKIEASNFAKFNVMWNSEHGLNATENEEYLNVFSQHFYRNVTKLIRRSMKKVDTSSFGKIVIEILQHSHTCNSIAEVFLGRQTELTQLADCVMRSDSCLILVEGNGGTGKTSILAKFAQNISQLCPTPKLSLILRFIGTTQESSSVISLMKSICQQISYNFMLPMDNIPDDLIRLSFCFKQLLLSASKEQPLFIILDAINQLSGPTEAAIKLCWLTNELPANVKVIVSCVSDERCKEYKFLRKVVKDELVVHVGTMDKLLASNVIESMLRRNGRTLTNKQWKVVQESLDDCLLPIFVKLVAAEVSAWKSYSTETCLSKTVMDSINNLLKRIEVAHGEVLVSHAFAYITASKSGLSESELEDLLSLDDIVLNDVYQYHFPPFRRIPPLLWTRIRNDIPSYLTDRDADGVTVINWYHRQFAEASVSRYLHDEQRVIYFHSSLADYFLGKWGGGRMKPFRYTEIQKQRFALIDDQSKADRKVPLQPTKYCSRDEKISYNLRKLNELPYHLCRANRFQDLFEKLLFNYEWLHSKLNSCSFQSILADFEDAKEYVMKSGQFEDSVIRELDLLADALKLAATTLIRFPDMLSSQIVSRLLPLCETCPNIRSLVKQCDEQSAEHCALIPVNHCLHTPGGPLMYSLHGHPFAVFDFVFTSDCRYIVSASNKFIIWDLSTGEITREIDADIEGVMLKLIITNDDKTAIAYTSCNDVYGVDILGNHIYTLLSNEINFSENIRGLTADNHGITAVVWTRKELLTFNLQSKFSINCRFKVDDLIESRASLLAIDYCSKNDMHVILESSENVFVLQTISNGRKYEKLRFKGGYALNANRDVAFVGTENGNVTLYRRTHDEWIFGECISSQCNSRSDELLSLTLGACEQTVIAIYLRRFTIFNTCQMNASHFCLPNSVLNVSLGPLQSASKVTLLNEKQLVIAGVRNNLYVWAMNSGDLLKILDAHFARITQMRSLTVGNMDAIVTCSIDRNVNVWNVNNLFQQVFAIDKMELSIDFICFSEQKCLALTVTRNSVAIWCLLTAKLKQILCDASDIVVVNQALITRNGDFAITCDTKKCQFWNLQNYQVMHCCETNIMKILLAFNDQAAILISEIKPNRKHLRMECICLPKISTKFVIETVSPRTQLKLPVITKKFLVVPVCDHNYEKLRSYDLQSGDLFNEIDVSDIHFNEIMSLHSFQEKENVITLRAAEGVHIFDVQSHTFLTTITRWNGECTNDGRFGLYCPRRGGLQLLELRRGTPVRILLPKQSKAVYSAMSGFVGNDAYVYYYNNTEGTIKLIRVEDCSIIANYKPAVEPKVIKGTPDGSSIAVGGADGSLVILSIVDTKKQDTIDRLQRLPNRITIHSSVEK